MEDVPALVETLSREGHLSHIVNIHLGSNRPFEAPVFDDVVKALLSHDVERAIFINVHRPIGWEYDINQTHLSYAGSETYVDAIQSQRKEHH